MNPFIRYASVVTVTLGLAAIARADQEYDWTGGSAGYSGSIVLDSNSNVAGTISDVVSAEVTTPQGTFDLVPSQVFYVQPVFDWNPSEITDMWIDWSPNGIGWAGLGANYGGSGVNFDGSGYITDEESTWSVDFAGSWTAVGGNAVPDGASTLGLLFGAIASITTLRRRFAS
jgi:hypothetical protein